MATGFPLWVAYRRGVGGPVGIFGDALPPDGDRFGRAARRLEELGAGAVLVHCLPPANAHGVAPWLRDFTSVPIGVYPNNGRYDMYTWRWEHTVSPGELADHASATWPRATPSWAVLRDPAGAHRRHREGGEARRRARARTMTRAGAG